MYYRAHLGLHPTHPTPPRGGGGVRACVRACVCVCVYVCVCVCVAQMYTVLTILLLFVRMLKKELISQKERLAAKAVLMHLLPEIAC